MAARTSAVVSIALILSCALVALHAQTEKTREAAASVCPGIDNTKLKRGEEAAVCIAFRAKNDRDEVIAHDYTIFRPRIDIFTQLVVESSFGTKYDNASLVEVQVELGSAAQQYARWQVYKQSGTAASQYSAPTTVVVGATDGEVKGSAWEFDCSPCDASDCLVNRVLESSKGSTSDGFCGISKVDCDADPRRCDFSVYLAWVGTDKDGNFLVSSGSVLSRFRAFSISGAYKDLATAASEKKESIASRVP